TLVTNTSIVVDARVPALAAAFIALRFKAPFILVVVIGAGTAALIRAQGWMA
ncbi:MAG: AzlD domain-containing protein, partial [Actinobacteria bacterium]|nr:AzlD domain-containing protein [Actinomycetota bacterium]